MDQNLVGLLCKTLQKIYSQGSIHTRYILREHTQLMFSCYIVYPAEPLSILKIFSKAYWQLHFGRILQIWRCRLVTSARPVPSQIIYAVLIGEKQEVLYLCFLTLPTSWLFHSGV